MSLPESITVLIVGAGPAGMATALSLHKQGIHDVVVVDGQADISNTSRAIVVHAATLEALDTIDPALADDIVAQGVPNRQLNIHNRSTRLAHVDFGASLDGLTKFPFALIIPQTLTELELRKKLKSDGIEVYRPMRVAGLGRNAQDNIYTDVSFNNGQVIKAKYVIGADGARSVVRSTAGIGFADPDGQDIALLEGQTNQMALADIIINNDAKVPAEFRGTASPGSIFIFMPLPKPLNELLGRSTDERIYRVICGVPSSEGEIPSGPNEAYMQQLADRFGPLFLSSDPTVNPHGTTIKEVIWSSRFRTHSAVADRTFTRFGADPHAQPSDPEALSEGGAILLVGDAAHIHSPAGGQGMNLGIRDSIFLGEVLAKHIRATEASRPTHETDRMLREFADSRRARALEIIGLTKNLLAYSGSHYSESICWWLPISKATVRDWLLWLVVKSSFVQSKIAWNLSGLGRR